MKRMPTRICLHFVTPATKWRHRVTKWRHILLLTPPPPRDERTEIRALCGSFPALQGLKREKTAFVDGDLFAERFLASLNKILSRLPSFLSHILCDRCQRTADFWALCDSRQGQRSAKLKGKKLEMSLQRLKHDLVKSRAMNECLRKEVIREARKKEVNDNTVASSSGGRSA